MRDDLTPERVTEHLTSLGHDLAHLRRQRDEEREALARATADVEAWDAAWRLLQDVAKATQERCHGQLAGVVTKCLRAVFGEGYAFRIAFERKRGRTEAVMTFLVDGVELDPTEEGSGGVLDVAAFALRLAVLCLTRPAPRRLVVLDEPFRFLNPAVHDKVPPLLHALARDLGCQFVMVTNIPALATGTVIDLS